MPVPSSISDLSTTPSLNSPAGTESPSTVDDYLRTHAAFIKQVDDKATGAVKATDLAAPGGSALVGFRQAGVGAVARTGQDKLRETVSVKDFGAVGDGVTDDTAAIQAAIDSLAEGGVLVDYSNATYLVDTLTIENKNRLTIKIYGTLRTTGSLVGGIVVKNCRFLDLYVKRIFKGIGGYPPNFNALTGNGIELVDVNNSEIGFNRLEGFATGVRLYSETASGVYFNNVRFNSIQYCQTNIQLNVANGTIGFVNGNKFYGGSLRGAADAGSLLKTTKGSTQIDPYNGNEFHVNLESGYVGIDLDFASGNYFSNRFESADGAINSNWIKSASNCFNNTYRANLFPLDKLQILGASETFVGPVMNTGTGVSYGHGMWSSQQGNQLHVLAFRDSSSVVTSSNGVPVITYVLMADGNNNSVEDLGITGLRIRDASGSKRVRYRREGHAVATNVNLDIPYNTAIIEVNSSSAAVDLRLKTSEYYVGNFIYVDVVNYVNNIRIMNEAGTSTILAAGNINNTGLWLVYITNGAGARARKLS